MNKVIKIFKAEIKSVNKETYEVDAVISTNAPDRYNEIVEPSAFAGDGLKNYLAHPILLSSHDYGDLRKQIGNAVSIALTDTGINARFRYYVGEGNAEADWAFKLAEKGFAAYSIGFMDKESTEGDGKEFRRKYIKGEMLEVSHVTVPAHPQALQNAAANGGISGELAEAVLRSFGESDYTPAKESETKAGRVLSQKNRELIGAAVTQTKEAVAALEELLTMTDEESKEAAAAKQADIDIQTKAENDSILEAVDFIKAKLKNLEGGK